MKHNQSYLLDNQFTLYNSDCLEILPSLPDKSIDLVLCDLPYGVSNCKWDSIIPFDKMWKELLRISKETTPIVLFANQPFTSKLICSQLELYKYDWIWYKSRPTNVLNAKKQPLRIKEDIVVFCKGTPTYYPQGLTEVNKYVGTGGTAANQKGNVTGKITQTETGTYLQEKGNYPRNVIHFGSQSKCVHPTQKPVDLLEYLIRTYTLEGETVLDFTMGSGSTGVACKHTGRKFIGIEKEKEYFEIALGRIEKE